MRNHLNRLSQIFAVPLFGQYVPVHFPRRKIGEFIQVLVDKPLVMSQVEIGFRAVLGNEYLSVLIRAHRAGIDIDIGIEFLRSHLIAAHF